MKAMVLKEVTDLRQNPNPLTLEELPVPVAADHEVLIKVAVCGVCHTELDEIEGRTPPPHLPVVLGHQVVGRVEKAGRLVTGLKNGDRVGVAWIFSACGKCDFCLSGRENLCPYFLATGRDANGGYAEYMTAPGKFTHKIPPTFTDEEAAPLLCAGAIGFRAVQLTQLRDGQRLGLTGFGASAHLVIKMVQYQYPATRIYVFARSESEQKFARELGAYWAGHTEENPPELLDCIIDTTPAWKPVVEALKHLNKGGRLVINAIRKEEADKSALLAIQYQDHLWMEKEVKAVANITRKDVAEFLQLAAEIPIKPHTEVCPLEQANEALMSVKSGKIRGAKVLSI